MELDAEGASVIRLGRHGYLSDVRCRVRETPHPPGQVRTSKRVIARHRNLRTKVIRLVRLGVGGKALKDGVHNPGFGKSHRDGLPVYGPARFDRAAVVLDTGAVTRGSGSKNEDKERNIRKWFVDHDLIDGVILLPDNLFYNTTAAGVIVVLNKRKPTARKDRIVLLNASKRLRKGKPKNYIPDDDIRPLAAAFLKGEPVEGEIAVITRAQAEEADYNLSPSRWVGPAAGDEQADLTEILDRYDAVMATEAYISRDLSIALAKLREFA